MSVGLGRLLKAVILSALSALVIEGAAPVSDDFSGSALNTSLWTIVNPVGDGTFSMTGTQLRLNLPAGSDHDVWTAGNRSIRAMQSISNANFQVVAKFDTRPSQYAQMQGILAQQDVNNYLRLDVYSDGASVRIFAASFVNNVPTIRVNSAIPLNAAPMWLRLNRNGNTWTGSWSTNGSSFTTAVTFTQAYTISSVGPFAANSGNPVPAWTALVDYFYNTASPGAGDPIPDLVITKSHSGSFVAGSAGSYTLAASNTGRTASSGTVTVIDTLPAGLSATAISGSGWNCTLATVSCARGDSLAAGATFPAITLTVNVAGNAPASITNIASVSGGGEINTANDIASDPTTITGGSGPGAPVSDDFSGSALNTSLWTIVNPVGDGTFAMTGTQLRLNLPAGSDHDVWTVGNRSIRAMQSISNANFQVVAKFDTRPSQYAQMQGILAQQDVNNYLRLDVYSDGASVRIFAASFVNNVPTIRVNSVIPLNAAPVWLQLNRNGNTWTGSWSTNGSNFTTAVTFTQAYTISSVGPFAANSANPVPAWTALVDYFYNSAAQAGMPDLMITKTHTGDFSQGGTGSYTLTASNSGSAATNSSVTVSDTLPTGLSAAAMSGIGWSCTLSSVSCTRSDVLAAGAAFPAITLTINVASNAPPSVTNSASVSGGGETNTSNDTASDATTISATGSNSPMTDDFQSGSLNASLWTVAAPAGGTVSVSGSSALLMVPGGNAHDAWSTGNNTVRMMQSIANTDFEVEAKFSSSVAAQYQMQGILVEQDAANYLRFDVIQADCQAGLFIARLANSTASVYVNTRVRNGATLYLRVERTGTTYLASYSYDGSHWTPAVSITDPLAVNHIGVSAGNNGPNGGAAPAFTAKVDYFVNLQSPPSTLDGQLYPPSPAPPVIDIWYGPNQTFGENGVPQQWINVLGSVSSYSAISSLTYSLNGGPSQALWMGENAVRLVEPGIFNVEIDYADLQPSGNTVAITAKNALGLQSTQNVTVNYISGQTWPATTSVHWTPGANVQDLVQVIDGNWQIQPDGTVRTMESGYDRLLTLGQRGTWNNFEVTSEVTIHSLDCHDFGVGIVAGWQGHTTLQYGVPLPDQPRTGHPFPGLGWYSMETAPNQRLDIYSNTASRPEYVLIEDASGRTLQLEQKYIFKFNVQQNSLGGSRYSLKVWPSGSSEPATWDLQADGELSQGSVVLAAHRADMSFGTITVTSLSSAVPDMILTKSHSGNFPTGSTGSYRLTASNNGTAATAGTVIVTDTLPTGLAATEISGSGWNCTLTTLSCLRSDSLAAGNSYPPVSLTVNVASNAPSEVTNNATVSGGGETNAGNNTASDLTIIGGTTPGTPLSDDFNVGVLDTNLWAIVNPVGDGSYALTGTELQLNVPAGSDHDVWSQGNRSIRAMQDISNVDLQVVAKFDTLPSKFSQMQGLLAQQDVNNYLRLDLYSDGANVRIFSASFVNGVPTIRVNSAIPVGTAPVWLQLKRAGDSWTGSWSTDGAAFTTVVSFTQVYNISAVGPFAGNAGNPIPAWSALIDYFH